MLLGCLFLVISIIGELSVPLFIGRVIDLMQESKFDEVGNLCAYMLIVIVVSKVNSF